MLNIVKAFGNVWTVSLLFGKTIGLKAMKGRNGVVTENTSIPNSDLTIIMGTVNDIKLKITLIDYYIHNWISIGIVFLDG